MSMWPVSDRETREIMINFYVNYFEGIPKIEALRRAALAQMKKTPHPYFWGAFVGLGEPH
jgi:CHAT domain-containing protein